MNLFLLPESFPRLALPSLPAPLPSAPLSPPQNEVQQLPAHCARKATNSPARIRSTAAVPNTNAVKSELDEAQIRALEEHEISQG